jgi:hypothetical protein
LFHDQTKTPTSLTLMVYNSTNLIWGLLQRSYGTSQDSAIILGGATVVQSTARNFFETLLHVAVMARLRSLCEAKNTGFQAEGKGEFTIGNFIPKTARPGSLDCAPNS